MSLPPARSRAGFVSACQQVLALGVVLAVLTPAASVLSLDVVREAPASSATSSGVALPGTGRAPAPGAAVEAATVPTGPVDAEVEDHQLTAPAGARVAPGRLDARTRVAAGATQVRSEPLAVEDFGTVGVTWAPGTELDHDAVGVRYRDAEGAWSPWTEAEVEEDHGPDAGTPEDLRTRPGTDAVVVGDVDEVQVRVSSAGDAPADLRAVVVEPGEALGTARELPAIDTAGEDDTSDASAAGATTDDALELAATGSAPRPMIYSRAQWGADERLRSGSPSYGTVNAGFVHHTVNANEYDREDVPGILRSIYAYHTQSRGWSDVGYNFLVDRFGRIWEGRYGGVTRAVVGAHTLNYNSYSFAMSAIGNFDVARPPQVMVDAYAALFAWKLGIHGVDAGSMRQQVGSRTFPAINGHRDAGSTACPGRYLYEKLAAIRQGANALQEADPEPEPQPEPEPEPQPEPQPEAAPLDSDLTGDGYPDLVLRRASDQQAVVVPTGGLTDFGPAVAIEGDWAAWPEVSLSRDLSGDGRADLLARDADGTTAVAVGAGKGVFATPATAPGGPDASHELVVAVGDADADGSADLVGRRTGTSRLVAFVGDGAGGFTQERLGLGWARFERLLPAGDLTGDGDPDLLAQQGDGSLWLRAGADGQGYDAPVPVPGTWSLDDAVAPAGDLTRDGLADLVVRRAVDGTTVVVPGLGDGTLGEGLGRLARVRSGEGLTGGVQVGGSARPDLVVRRGDRLVWLADRGTTETLPVVETGLDLTSSAVVLNAGDWDGDGAGDLVTRSKGVLSLHAGDGTASFADPVALGRGFAKVRSLQAVGDVTGDGRADLTGRRDGVLQVYPGDGAAGIGTGVEPTGVRDPREDVDPGTYSSLVGVSDLRGKGPADLVGTDPDGRLWLLPVTRKGVGEAWLLAGPPGPPTASAEVGGTGQRSRAVARSAA
ncbi:FG-GAP-like repeat-containing protein [Nocardioides sp. AX2bis]|uniref:FG-GAP-like repeat-containing protein n=1 Tax=Nocardioides sp. AX2bis TaxID=2653157 RepID=UPI0012F20FB8|nr:FG-GAP-like repeat-containing protein [Nocardioides sp. AX2bis]VXB11190.1 N-acetylmuramoyl-L-alanine amidase, family 2 [Nocardioides sp. AX2bis]